VTLFPKVVNKQYSKEEFQSTSPGMGMPWEGLIFRSVSALSKFS
jgi:hypothetical protein